MMRERRCGCSPAERQRAIQQMSLMIEEVSELLYASMVWGEEYPELCTCLDGFAVEVAEEIRDLGRWMLRRGIDPPIGRLCHGSRRREHSPRDVIRALLSREECIERLKHDMPEGDHRFSARAEERIRHMRRMLS